MFHKIDEWHTGQDGEPGKSSATDEVKSPRIDYGSRLAPHDGGNKTNEDAIAARESLDPRRHFGAGDGNGFRRSRRTQNAVSTTESRPSRPM